MPTDALLRSRLIHAAADLPKGSRAVDARLLQDITRMTDRNDHNGALLALAKLLRAKRYEQILGHIIGISDILGHNPLTSFRYNEVYKPLMALAKSKLDPDTYAQIHGAF